ncbi:DNA-directed RNA polymerase I subunit RPA34 [Alligator mississippiensis]|nr:DNA-directed RNA polymerase I subunit RPA34 [Alligator mississippiensis]
MEPRGRAGALPRFQCPPDFSASPCMPEPPLTKEALQGPSKELWLIRAPADFTPDSLDGCTVVLAGAQTLRRKLDGARRLYGIHGTQGELGSTCLLAPSAHSGQLCCAPPFCGTLSIYEKFGDPSSGGPPLAVPSRPAPQVPAGLKQRFLPFGGSPKGQCPVRATGADAEPELGSARKRKKRRRVTEELAGNLALLDTQQETPEELGPWGGGCASPKPPTQEQGPVQEPSPSHKRKRKHKRAHGVPQDDAP